jgi:hypothetical protein
MADPYGYECIPTPGDVVPPFDGDAIICRFIQKLACSVTGYRPTVIVCGLPVPE